MIPPSSPPSPPHTPLTTPLTIPSHTSPPHPNTAAGEKVYTHHPLPLAGSRRPYATLEDHGYTEQAARELVARLGPLPAAERDETIDALPEQAGRAVRALLGSAWSAYAALQLEGYDQAAARELVATIAPLQLAPRAAAIAALPEGARPAVCSLIIKADGMQGNQNAAKPIMTLLKKDGSAEQERFIEMVANGAQRKTLLAEFDISPTSYLVIKRQVSERIDERAATVPNLTGRKKKRPE